MTALSRRQFGRVVIAGAPLSALLTARLRASAEMAFGVATSSFRDLPRVTFRDNVDAVIRALKAVKVSRVELAMDNVEPAPPSTSPTMGGTPAYPQLIILTPEQIAFVKAQYRRTLRQWRTEEGREFFAAVRGKFDAAGLTIHNCAQVYDDECTDPEIEAMFRAVTTLGVTTVSSPMTLDMAKRLVPFAERHHVSVAIHNQVDGNADKYIGAAELERALALSPAFRIKLDIGNLTASNGDAVAAVREYQARVSHVLVKDRLRNGGASQHFGEGDTPIPAVLNLLKSAATPIPAFVEYDYVGLHSSIDEVTASVAYLTHALK